MALSDHHCRNKLMRQIALFSSFVTKCHQNLDGKSVCSVCSLMVKFNIDLSFSDMKRFYSIKKV